MFIDVTAIAMLNPRSRNALSFSILASMSSMTRLSVISRSMPIEHVPFRARFRLFQRRFGVFEQRVGVGTVCREQRNAECLKVVRSAHRVVVGMQNDPVTVAP